MSTTYYKRHGIEVKDVLDQIYTFFDNDITPKEGAYIFNIVKYLMRYKFKDDPISDLEKLETYLEWLKEEEEFSE